MNFLNPPNAGLAARQAGLVERLEELERMGASGSSEREALEERSRQLEEKTNLLVADNTVLARALTAVEAWGDAMKGGPA